MFIDFEKPNEMVSKYRAIERAEQKNKKSNEEQKMLIVASSRNLADVILLYYKKFVSEESNSVKHNASTRLRG